MFRLPPLIHPQGARRSRRFALALIALLSLMVALFWAMGARQKFASLVENLISPLTLSTQVFVMLGQTMPSSIDLALPDHLAGIHNDFEIALAQTYAQQQGRNIQWVYQPTSLAINSYLSAHPQALAIGMPQEEFADTLSLPPYRESRLVLVGPKSNRFPETLLSPSSPSVALPPIRLVMLANNPHRENMTAFIAQYPQINLQLLPNSSTLELLHAVTTGMADFALLEHHEWGIVALSYPDWRLWLAFDKTVQMGWRASRQMPTLQQNQLLQFFQDIRENGTLLNLSERFQPDLEKIDPLDLDYFDKRKKLRLPAYRAFFETAAKETDLPVNLLIALAYQESQWDENAVSPTGAKGLMMINDETARYLRLPDNADASSQIISGARYLKMLHEDLFAIPEPDRTLIALSGYNIGPGALTRIMERASYLYPPLSSAYPSTPIPLLTDKAQQSMTIPIPKDWQKYFHNDHDDTTLPAGKLIRLNWRRAQWQNMSWARLRYYIIQQSLQGKISTQPVVLTERVRIFWATLDRESAKITD